MPKEVGLTGLNAGLAGEKPIAKESSSAGAPRAGRMRAIKTVVVLNI